MKAQRLRIRLTLDESVAQMSYRQLVSALEHTCEAAGLNLSRSVGKRVVAQIALGAPLPQGVTSDCEFVDLFLAQRINPSEAIPRLGEVLPDGVSIVSAEEIGLNAPSLSSTLRWADYEVTFDAADRASDVQQAIDRLLAADSLPMEYRRENKVRRYDLRPLIYDLRLDEGADGCFLLRVRLRAEQDNTARADQVVLALGLRAPRRIHRRRLYLEEVEAAVLAHRRQPEPDDS